MDSPPRPPELVSAEHVTRRRKARKNVNEAHKGSLNGLERVALWITENIGTMGFFIIVLCWTVCWMSWNYLAARNNWPGVFDKPFEFGVWLFISNLIQLMLLPLIMLGQNLQSRHAELRAEQEFHLTEQTEHEMGVALHYLEQIHREVKGLGAKVDSIEKRVPTA